MKCTIVGSRYFGASVLEAFRADGIEIAGVVAPAADDRLAVAARAAGLPTAIHDNPRLVEASAIPEDTGLIIAAHTHARVTDDALARSRLGGVGYHPSLLPRHRGIAAVEWTILEGDPIAGGSVYHLSHGWDAGAIAAQDWCFVKKGETARELWERALAPMGLALLLRVAHHAREHGALPASTQDEQFATRAPIIRRRIELTEETPGPLATMVVTAIGADRPGIVNQLSERARAFGANWMGSRMASLGSQFAGMVQLEVAQRHADALTTALRDLESAGLRLVIARSDLPALAHGRRRVSLELTAPDRPGIVQDLSASLSAHDISIEELNTELAHAPAGPHQFGVKAVLAVPDTMSIDALRALLESLAAELMADMALGEGSA
ncbi:ACT domain-containing protein [Paraburkholderia rhizosphaerae]|uniref:Glycine cleavage system regulatory protein n=1 Tax=Paraburkholderia rhizosphaerae TaxID=480658 RepID=A0A4R8LVS4_9BURK|nr:ACT domain-containing protein [Paraburkholderia rhizosphaerae]TDY51844.1 glycine cleavage system regulatory protein [Paraburkholderia rhizosphaerae]